jgi:hypothetical protein
MLLLALLGCPRTYDDAPLGMILREDGVTYAGAAVVDLTPEIRETFTDLNGDHLFDGCLDRPDGTDCASGSEPFDDADGDGWFDATWIGGYSPLRPALAVHDAVYARATVISQDGEYVAFVALDFVGVGSPRIDAARERLRFQGFDAERLVAAASHNHQGPDTMGLWGNPYDFANPTSGMDAAYQERVTAGIEQAVREAADAMEAVHLRVGATRMRDRSVWFNGEKFGGKNPTAKMHGMIHDIRDPVVVSDQLLALQGRRDDGSVVFTLTNWSGHPEVRGGDNNDISSDWVGVSREVIEDRYGGVAMHLPECLGGMQSALGGDLPLVNPDGTHVLSGETDADGDAIPVWAPHDSWEFVTSHGWHIGEAAIDALEGGEDVDAAPISARTEPFYVPIENIAYQLLGPKGMFDLDLGDAEMDPALCPEASTGTGCIRTVTSRVQVGPISFVGVPGELLPEIAWGFPTDDPQWELESADLTARGPDSRYFPQHDADCDTLGSYAECSDDEARGECNCLSLHAWPYAYAADPAMPPLLDLVDGEYRAVIGMQGDYLSYIIPEPDFNTAVSLLNENDGDHYEDTVSPAHNFATRLQEAQLRLAD